MHERALMRAVVRHVREVAEAEGAARVTRVDVRLGPLSHFTPERFREHFADAARGTVAEHARVHARCEEDSSGPAAASVVVERVEIEERR